MIDTQERLKVALVHLDGHGVPDWVGQSLEHEPVELVVAQCESREELARHAADAHVVWLFGGSLVLNGNLDVLKRCWAIIRTGSGTDNVPVDDATRRGILVANTPTAFCDGVSDHVIALLFATVRRIAEFDRSMRAGRWLQTTAIPLNSVRGKTLGLVGFGHAGREVARKLVGFELNLLVYDPYASAATLDAHRAKAVPLDTLLAESDYVSLHCPLTKETTHLIGERQLRAMKPTAILINTARGPVVDEPALVRALSEGWITAAGLDVFEQEPPDVNNPLFKMDNVVLTPHGAGYSINGVELRWRASLEVISALAKRRWPPSCVNPQVKPALELSR